ncbi:polyamine-transporting ATPase 13A3 isoform X2 [Tribolium castaneum]|uniref:polyamine-transporting ATPase 13A3 isoform X2 n=1 Tax=Tribolium castaneum TaxID=7070 RepID=UPI00077DD00D|nr:PREDICTED: probable cation-transporting ATPase 13A3 isoform X2 [Tribolium castaneum]|eukprot:XP_015834823.1 PREDICTED: probable cation-transporting ATPase 13A3 isoform X2 [Tribolium castaneum]
MPRNNSEYEPIGESSHQTLDLNLEDFQCDLYGFTRSSTRTFFYHFLGIVFLGIPYLLSSWFSRLKSWRYRKCSLKHANIVLIKDVHGNSDFVEIKTENAKLPNYGHVYLRFFTYQHAKYVWIPHSEIFGTLDLLIPPQTVDSYVNNTDGLFYNDYVDLLKLYGSNKIEIEVKSYWRLFVDEVFNPFYVFQAFSMTLWCFDHYYIYACCVFILTLFSVITALRQTRKQSEALHDLVESSKCHNVRVLRRNLLSENVLQEADPSELVPGDLIVLPKANFVLPCDVVLLTGQCIVNESVLTGESVPVTKTALHSSNEIYNPNTHKRHTLFSGTFMIQSRYYGGEDVLARVVTTGFNTTKGALVKSILFPTPVGLQFYKDSLKFVLALFIIAGAGTAYCLYLYTHRKAEIREIVIRSLDVITIVVPPALPAAMTVGIVYSQSRLKKLKIFCISPPKINVCGKLKLACFDKTGTLTQDGLDMHSIVPCVNGTFGQPITECFDCHDDRLVQAMATCHSLTQIAGELTGDPLDLSMFHFTKWILEEPGDDETARFDMLAPTIVKPVDSCDTSEFPYQLGIIRQFPFSSTLQCMSVICKELSARNMIAFTKGAPEKISAMCQPQSLPEDFHTQLSQLATQGYRVIALAWKQMPVKFKWKEAQRVKRDIVECDLTFLGLLVMQNTLKPETTPIIRLLHDAKIRTVMITGDNILTAISVARDCEMVKSHDQIFIVETKSSESGDSPELVLQNIDSASTHSISIDFDFSHCHLAIDGKTWTKIRSFYPDLVPSLLIRTTIFARFQPDQKTQVITHLQSLDYVVSMVGDGANDCGALKAAHVGVSLSQAEASVAAPFTSAIQDISCIVHLMLEGRCALVTSFAVFKYMALYSLIQFTTVLILYRQNSVLGDVQFLFIDLIITTSLAVTIGRQGPSGKLGVKRPPGSLVAAPILIPILLQVVLCVVVQVGSMLYLFQQEWFKPVPSHTDHEYLILAFVYSKGKPFRQRLIRNFWFLLCAVFLTLFQIWLLVSPTRKVAEFFEIMFLPHKAKEQIIFRYKLLLIPLGHLLAAVFIEVAIADRTWLKKLLHCVTRKKVPKNKYKLLLQNNDIHLNLLNFNN